MTNKDKAEQETDYETLPQKYSDYVCEIFIIIVANLNLLMTGSTTVYDEILSDIEKIEKDEQLYRESNFSLRLEAIDFIDFHVIDRIESIVETMDMVDSMLSLKQHAQNTKCALEKVNSLIFNRIRSEILQENHKPGFLWDLLNDYHFLDVNVQDETDIGYDNLDVFFNGLLDHEHFPEETKDREPEMVFYQKTPARVVFEVIKRAGFKPDDVFFDLGSGLGQVNILVNLFTGIASKGVEFEPAFCNYATACANSMGLNKVEFINIDARDADYSSGTVFFFYTPFKGKMLAQVLQKLKKLAKKKELKIFTFGPCTHEIARQPWLISNEGSSTLSEFGYFNSI